MYVRGFDLDSQNLGLNLTAYFGLLHSLYPQHSTSYYQADHKLRQLLPVVHGPNDWVFLLRICPWLLVAAD